MTLLREPSIFRCDNPEAELWRHLQWAFSPSYMREALRRVHKSSLGAELLEDKVAGVASCVQQAKEFFTASAIASLDYA